MVMENCVREGARTIPERLEILTTHNQALIERIAELRQWKETIQHKIAYCEGVLSD